MSILKVIAFVQSGLNDDQWHNASITVDLITGQLIVGLNNMKVDRRMTRFTLQQTTDGTMTSLVSIGGTLFQSEYYLNIMITLKHFY